MRYLLAGLFLLLFSQTVYAGGYRRQPITNVENTYVTEVKGEERNFFAPLTAEVNVTPQRFRTDWFKGVYSTTGVEVGGHEPVWFAGAVARFDAFPNRGRDESDV